MSTSGQLNLFENTTISKPCEGVITYADIQTAISNSIDAHGGDLSNIEFTRNKDSLAVSFFSFGGADRSLWVTLGKKRHRLAIKFAYYFVIDSLMDKKDSIPRISAGRAIFYFHSIEELLSNKQLIFDIYDYREREAKGVLFDCCHRYLECSDALSCIHPDSQFAMCCSYRRKLKDGVVFYGRNRNVK